jgi:hypothetical protein
MALASTTGTLTAVANGSAFMPETAADLRALISFNVALWGTFVATVILEKSFDNGVTYVPVLRPGGNTAVSYSAPSAEVIGEPEDGVLYRLRCTAYTSGTVNYRLSK